ncbi:MAG: sigma-54-dependent Fis family transcriptional regulator [Xanthomonadales bacterium]|nr:sigma-54-dependent Fis family transcriptional regulator [Xanthomonadales bacterium]
MTPTPAALVVEDEADLRELIELSLAGMDLDVVGVGTLAEANEQLARRSFSLCLTDLRLPDGMSLPLVEKIGREHPHTPVAVLTAYGNVETAVQALKVGAFDFVAKPVDIQQLRRLVETALRLGAQRPVADATARLIGESPAVQQARATIAKLARSQAPVYISGESGSGKELAARLIHELSPRGHGPFVPVNCGAIPAELLESEFFGHKKGSFTGAAADKPGLFQAAHGGTLLLDEVAELPMPMQVKLLRAIQEKAIRPIGANVEQPVDVRLISATHKSLHQLVERGAFRQDLYYRINVIELPMPPLRERREDIPILARHILGKLDPGGRVELSAEAMDALRGYGFPGNIRELENVLERAMALCDGDRIGVDDLHLPQASPVPGAQAAQPGMAAGTVVMTGAAAMPSPGAANLGPGWGSGGGAFAPGVPVPAQVPVAAPPAGAAGAAEPGRDAPLEDYIEQLERDRIMKALEANRYNKTKTAQALGITFRALRYRLKKLGIE